MQNKVKIGIPRALLYHKYFIIWRDFFEVLGCEIVVSPETNQDILKAGVRLSIDESCLSLKIMIGHCYSLIGKCDYLFLPRIVSCHKGEETCVKLWALVDIIRNTIPELKVIDYTVDVKNHKYEFIEMFKLGWSFSKNPFKIIYAYVKGKRNLADKRKKDLDKQWNLVLNNHDKKPNVLLISHPYTTYDAYLGRPIINLLKEQGINVILSDITNHDEARKFSKNISEDLYWTYNKEIIGAIEYYKGYIDGILFLMTFPCGPDALVIDLCQNKIKGIPMVVISLDELQAEAGLRTRIESFADILKMRRKKYGK